MSPKSERTERFQSTTSDRKELYQALPVIWGEINRVISNPNYAKEFFQELLSWWKEIFTRSVSLEIGINPDVKRRQLSDKGTNRDVVALSRATQPVISFDTDVGNGSLKYVLEQRVQRESYDQVVFYVDPENKIGGIRKVVATRTSKMISLNGTRPSPSKEIQRAEIEFHQDKLLVRSKKGKTTKTVEIELQ